ncbi:hypothetical protein LXL04_028058 [Taraxacum kok-saghyz]
MEYDMQQDLNEVQCPRDMRGFVFSNYGAYNFKKFTVDARLVDLSLSRQSFKWMIPNERLARQVRKLKDYTKNWSVIVNKRKNDDVETIKKKVFEIDITA